MLRVEVSRNQASTLKSDIDFSSNEWLGLLPENMSKKFKIEEMIRMCSAYPEGLFPLSVQSGNKQATRINRFANYIEYSRVVSSEVVNVSGQLFLTTKFYDNRKEGWSSKEIKKKIGDTVGYCINGDVYCAEDKDSVYAVYYKIVYKSLVKKDPKFNEILTMLKDGVSLTLIASDDDFLKNFKIILLESM